jgi:formiminotetrahydrofolate cyclodeaminase
MDRKYEEDTNDTDDIVDEEETINDTFEEGSKEDPLG